MPITAGHNAAAAAGEKTKTMHVQQNGFCFIAVHVCQELFLQINKGTTVS